MYQSEFQPIVKAGIEYLHSQQQKDGSFLSISSVDPLHFSKPIIYSTTFLNSLILLTLHTLPSTVLSKKIKTKTANFLLSQKSSHWSWNYWVKSTKERQILPYPDDLDDTFCALTALYQYDSQIIDGEALAAIVHLLTATEEEEGGPYKTWIITNDTTKKWSDIDLAVNSNIAYFLFLNEISLPKLNKFIRTNIANENFISPYYPSIFPVIYFLSRFYNGKSKKKIVNTLLSKREKNYSWGNPLNTALAISSLLNLGFSPEKLTNSISYLTKNPQKIYQSYPFCMDPTRDSKKYFAGSPALTISFILEAITKYTNAFTKKRNKNISQIVPNEEAKITTNIITTIEKRFEHFDTPFKKKAYSILEQSRVNDPHKQISLLPYYFSLSLGEGRKKILTDLLIKLGVANVFGWIAYTIYDDFLDEEGQAEMLPFANIALRETMQLFETIVPHTDFSLFSQKVMDQLEQANYWEIINCRIEVTNSLQIKWNALPNFKNHHQLAHKSLGHALGPIAILFFLGYKKNSSEVKKLLLFFTHYLIIKQLHDDAHDWEADLRNGQINAVGSLLLKRCAVKYRNASIDTLLPYLQNLFWHEVILDVDMLVNRHSTKAKNALRNCTIIVHPEHLEKLLKKYEEGISLAVQERENTLTFLKHYNV